MISVSFPRNLCDKLLVGKRAVLEVTVLKASHQSLPAVMDELANTVRPGLALESLKEELWKAVNL